MTSDMKPPHDFVYTQKFNFGGPNESQQVIATSNWYVLLQVEFVRIHLMLFQLVRADGSHHER